MRKHCLLFIPMLFALSFVACDDANTPPFPEPTSMPLAPPSPVITSVTPAWGSAGTEITILGRHLENEGEYAAVRLNASILEPISVSANAITIIAPSGYSKESVDIALTLNGKTSNTVSFIYADQPTINTLTPSTAGYGQTVKISGTNFSLNAAENIVMIGDERVEVVAATETELTVEVPYHYKEQIPHPFQEYTPFSFPVTVEVFGLKTASRMLKYDQIAADAGRITRANWTTTEIRPGLIWKESTLSAFGGSTQRVNVLDITPSASNTLGIHHSATFKTTSTLSGEANAIAAINAGYFQMTSGTTPKDPYIRIDGVTAQVGTTDNVSAYFIDACLTFKNNSPSCFYLTGDRQANAAAAALSVTDYPNVITSGPFLVNNGKIASTIPPDHNSVTLTRTARTAAGVTADKRLLLVTVDTGSGSAGVTCVELAQIMRALGAVNAVNFDGGGSTTMYVKGKGDSNGIVNKPSGGVQRYLANIIYVKQ